MRWATADDLLAFYARHRLSSPRPTMTAMVGELDGEIIAVGGFTHQAGRLIAFYDQDERARRYKITLVKAARQMVADMVSRGGIMLAEVDPREPGAERWIKSLGFVETDVRRIFEWKAAE